MSGKKRSGNKYLGNKSLRNKPLRNKTLGNKTGKQWSQQTKRRALIVLGLLLALLSGRNLSPYLFDGIAQLADENAGYETSGGSTGVPEPAGDAAENYAWGNRTAAEQAELLRIVDGDTIWVRIDGAEEREKVRFLEINTPESVHSDKRKNTEYGEAASKHLKELLDGVETVWLTKDRSDTDQYGRLLRMVWTVPPTDPFSEAELREKCLNARLILDGYALPVTFDDYSYEDLFRKFMKEAERENRGLWADAGWRTYVKKTG